MAHYLPVGDWHPDVERAGGVTVGEIAGDLDQPGPNLKILCRNHSCRPDRRVTIQRHPSTSGISGAEDETVDGFETEIADLRSSAAAAMSAGEQASEINLGAAVSSVVSALPGSESAVTAGTLTDAWDNRLASWAADVRGFADSVSASADSYAANDEQAEAAFSSVLPEFLDRVLPW